MGAEPWFAAPGETDWRESDTIQQARQMLADIGSPLWPGLTESDWAEVLRGVLAERDFIGDWLQRCLDADHARTPLEERARAEAADIRESFDLDIPGTGWLFRIAELLELLADPASANSHE